MKIESVWAALLCVAFASGCGKSVSDVCNDLDSRCEEVAYDECVANGNELSDIADAHDCSDKFGDYLDCVAEASCGWAGTCSAQKMALEACTGPFPQ